MSLRKLEAWHDAGLIDSATAERIRAWETSRARPRALWALIGLGALSVGLGLLSVVAAHWEEIPGTARLTLHLALIATFAGAIVGLAPVPGASVEGARVESNGRRGSHSDQLHEARLFVFGALTLTFFGHLGQVYQSGSPLWQPLALWMVLVTPLLLSEGRGWPVASLWMAGLVGTTCAHAATVVGDDRFWSGEVGGLATAPVYWGLIATPPMLATALGAVMRDRSARPEFWRRIEQVALAVIILGASVSATLGGDWGRSESQSLEIAGLHAAFLAIAAAIVWQARPDASGPATATVLVAAGASRLLPLWVPDHRLWFALCFMALWAAIAGAALNAGWRGIFQIAVAVLSLRLIVLSFELANDLLGSGLGLLFAGLATLGMAWVGVRFSQRYAPQASEHEAP